MTNADPPVGADATEQDARDEPIEGLEPGRVLADRYRLVRLIGRGGMGAVWEAEQIALGRRVALKVIRSGIDHSDTAHARFVREARSAAGLDSPHVVQIFDYGVDDRVPYIAMELLSGESLADRLDRERRLSPALTMHVVRQVGKALSRAHAADIVHRDLKPDNVFLCEDPDDPDGTPTVKVLDFGIAKQRRATPLDAGTRTGAMLGTPYYMSPEHARNPRRADARSDLWSLGVLAYECLVGARPFDAESLPALSVQILVDAIPVPSRHADVPAGFDAWFSRALMREPDERFQSAREMTRALATALGQPGLSTLSREVEARIEPTGDAGLGRYGWIAAVVIVGAAIGGYAMTRSPQPEREATPAAAPVPPAALEPQNGHTSVIKPEPEPEPEPVIEAKPETDTEPVAGTEVDRSTTTTKTKKKSGAPPTTPAVRTTSPTSSTSSTRVDDLEF